MIPFGKVKHNFCSFNNLPLDWLLEHNLHLPTFAKTTVNFANQITFIDCDLFSNKSLEVCLFVKQIFNNNCVGID